MPSINEEENNGKREAAIQVKNVRKVYRMGDEEVVALNRINLTIYKGEICCIFGTSRFRKEYAFKPARRDGKTNPGRSADTGTACFQDVGGGTGRVPAAVYRIYISVIPTCFLP